MTGERKRRLFGLIVAGVVLVGGALLLIYLHYRSTHVTTDDAFVDGHIFYVSARIQERVTELLVDDNQPVERGQLLVRLDSKDLEAALFTSEQNLAAVRNQVAAQQASLEVVAAQIEQLSAQVALAARERARADELFRLSSITREEHDRVVTQWRAVSSQLAAAQAQQQQTRATLGPPDEKGKVAAVRLAEAQREQILVQLGYTVITAPTAGFVTRRTVEVGQVVQVAQPLMAIVPLTGLYVTANYKETQLTDVEPGQRVTIHVDTYPQLDLEGRVESIMAGTGSVFSVIPPQNATGNYIKVVQRLPVRIAIEQPGPGGPQLRLGMSVEPTIHIGERQGGDGRD